MLPIDYMQAKGWLTPNERDLLKKLAERVTYDGVIVNVGVEFGASLACLRAGNEHATLIGIDLDNSKFVGEAAWNVQFHQGDSGTLGLHWPMNIDLAFIDGDHTDRGITRDMVWTQYIRLGGVIAFHDAYSWEDPGKPHKIAPDVTRVIGDWYIADGYNQFRELPYVDSIRLFQRVA